MSGITQIDSEVRLQYLEVLSLSRIYNKISLVLLASLAKKSESHFHIITTLTCQQLGNDQFTALDKLWPNLNKKFISYLKLAQKLSKTPYGNLAFQN